ncbi:MAG TPA: hypothetical protein H9870_00645 [Candidatus Corynebacterium avicola]|uniref:Cupin domain-containing protein n=1 Tax=Candidatus Corynebacterium avicola TaxID=2838527 RepID=A0A9D1RMD5_9CORY|nr:hypothetical protein [Candidatus Corynebacterium avicola]
MADWTYIDGLADAHPGIEKTDYEIPRTDITKAKPEVDLRGVTDGARVIRLAFRDGDVMPDHHAAAPILIIGQSGAVEITVGGAEEPVTLTPGTALHIAAKVAHSLTALEPATVTLLVLG